MASRPGPVSRLVARAVTGPEADHGEGPVWDPASGVLRYVDLLAGDLLTLGSDGEVHRRHLDGVVAAWRPRRDGGLVVATGRGFTLLDPGGEVEWRSGDLWSDPGVRFNDGAADPAGNFWCGTMAYDERPGAGALWRLRPDRTVALVEPGLTIANGLAFDADGHGGLHVDTPTGRVDRFVLDGDTVHRSGFVTIPAGRGFPDGICVDAEGGVWVALWDGGAVHRYRPDGGLDAVVTLPVSRVTACALGGPGQRRLYVTTSAQGIDRQDEPAAGSLFAVDVEVPGRPVFPFAG